MKIYVEVQSDINNKRMEEYEKSLQDQQKLQQQLVEAPKIEESNSATPPASSSDPTSSPVDQQLSA